MGRKGAGRVKALPPAILAGAEETYRLERSAGTEEAEARARAIVSALASQDRHTRADVAEMAARMAEELDDGDDDDMATDGPAALLWLVKTIQDTLPQD